jgi:hypothetical protein
MRHAEVERERIRQEEALTIYPEISRVFGQKPFDNQLEGSPLL